MEVRNVIQSTDNIIMKRGIGEIQGIWAATKRELQDNELVKNHV